MSAGARAAMYVAFFLTTPVILLGVAWTFVAHAWVFGRHEGEELVYRFLKGMHL